MATVCEQKKKKNEVVLNHWCYTYSKTNFNWSTHYVINVMSMKFFFLKAGEMCLYYICIIIQTYFSLPSYFFRIFQKLAYYFVF